MRSLFQRFTLLAGAAFGLFTIPSAARAQKALVYCPVNVDATGCNAIVTALGPSYALGVDRAYDGTGGTVDLKTVDLFAYSVFVVPSLADNAAAQPYARLREPEVVEHLKAALIGRIAMWSGSPDQGATNRAAKDALMQNLAGWASGAFGTAKGPGLVALLDASSSAGARYDWLRAITPLPVTADANLLVYDAARALDPRGTSILTSGAGPIAYANMATYGFQVPNGAPGVSLDAVGQTGTTQGGQVILVTAEAGNTSQAVVRTDKDDYAPGTTVLITGSGWQAGETVKLTLHMDPLRDADTELTATADGSGNFTNAQFAPAGYDVGVRFVVTALGQGSGRRAQTTFTDAAHIKTVTVIGVQTTNPVAAGGSTTYGTTASTSVKVEFNGNGSCRVRLSAAGLPVGATATFAPDTLIGDNNVVFSQLTITTTAATPGGTTSFTVSATGTGGTGNDCPTNESISTVNTSALTVAAPVSTTLSLAAPTPASVTFGSSGPVTLSATLIRTTGGAPVAGATVTFTVDGSSVGSGTTNVSGVAALAYNPSTLSATSHNVQASFANQTISSVSYSSSTSNTQTLAVGQAAQAITFTSPAPTTAAVGGPTYTVTAIGGGSGNPVTFTSGTPVTCSIVGAVVSMTAVGQCTINANQAGSTNYLAAPQVAQSFIIGKGAATITLANLTHTYDRTAKAATATTAPSGLTVLITYTLGGNPVTNPTNAGSYAVTATITDPNYQGSTTGTLAIAQKQVTGSFTSPNKVYDRTTAAAITSPQLSGVIAPDVVTLTGGTATFADKDVGNTKTVTGTGFTLGGADAGNYVLASATLTATASITQRSLIVSATAQNKAYDATIAATVTLTDDRIAGDVFSTSFTAATFADKNVGTNKVVSVSGIALSGPDAGNYSANTTCTTAADITAKAVTGSFTANNKLYDATTAATIATRALTGALLGDDVSLTGGTATFVDKNVGNGKAVNGSGFTLGGADALNYSLASSALTASANITPRALTITATGVSRVYDGTTVATVTLSDNRAVGDNLSPSYGSAAFADKNVGTNKTISVAGITLGGGDANNYTFNVTATATANIMARALTISAAGQNKVYDGTTTATVTLADDRVAGDVFTDNYTSASFNNKNAGAAKPVTVTGVSISGIDVGNYTFNATANATADITPRALIVTATGIDKIYDGTATATVTLGDNRIAGDNFTASYSGASFSDKSVGSGKSVNVSGISLGGADAGNYTPNTTASTTAGITKRALTVSAAAQNKVYDGTTTATVTLSDDRVAGDNLTTAYALANFADKDAGNGKTVTVSGILVTGVDAGNYSFNASTTTTADITKRPLTVTVTGINKVYDGTTAATVTLADNRLSGDVLTESYAAAAFADKNVGNGKAVSVSGISLSGTDAGNYTFNTTAAATADITPRALLVTATGIDRVYDATTAATVTLTDNRVAGDVFTDSYTSASFADKNVGTGKTVTINGISISGADAGNYTSNTATTTTATITVATLTGSFTANSKVYDGTMVAMIATRSVAGVLSSDVVTLTSGTATFADKNVGTGKTVTGVGFTLAGGDAANYVLASTTLATTADITARPLTVTATGINKVYDGTTAATVTLADNRVSGDTFADAYASATFANPNVGTGKAVSVSGISISGADAGNYTFNSSASTTANITTKALTVTADNKQMNFGQSPPAYTVTPNGFVSGEGFGNLTGSIQFATSPVNPITNTTFAGTYTIIPSGVSSSNYTITFTNGTLTITDATKPVVTNTVVNPVQIGGSVVLTSTISDELTGHTNISSASYTINGGPPQPMTAVDGSFNSFTENVKATITAPLATGVLTVCVTGRDALPPANESTPECVLLAVYDPAGGFVTGGGWINSPVGAYTANLTLVGKANFGFVSKYKKGQTTPDGNTEFQFQAAGLNFKATSYDWLVIAGAKAQYKGSGTINGSGDYGFILTGTDGTLKGNGSDTFRMKIWIKATGAIVYDNLMNAPDTAEPTTTLGGGSIQIHDK